MAGSMRRCYPPNVHIIRVPCSGKVDAIHIMKAFQKGADGVYVAGCLEGDCHFKNGNTQGGPSSDVCETSFSTRSAWAGIGLI